MKKREQNCATPTKSLLREVDLTGLSKEVFTKPYLRMSYKELKECLVEPRRNLKEYARLDSLAPYTEREYAYMLEVSVQLLIYTHSVPYKLVEIEEREGCLVHTELGVLYVTDMPDKEKEEISKEVRLSLYTKVLKQLPEIASTEYSTIHWIGHTSKALTGGYHYEEKVNVSEEYPVDALSLNIPDHLAVIVRSTRHKLPQVALRTLSDGSVQVIRYLVEGSLFLDVFNTADTEYICVEVKRKKSASKDLKEFAAWLKLKGYQEIPNVQQKEVYKHGNVLLTLKGRGE